MYHQEWIETETGILMVMSEEVIQTFRRYVQDEMHKDEAGGILLGARRGDHFEVISGTEPTRYDVRARTHWQRSEKIHSTIARQAWEKSGGMITYLGEWHTHPENIPSPSSIDIKEWNKLSAACLYRAGYTMVIVGTNDLWCGVARGKTTILQMTEIT